MAYFVDIIILALLVLSVIMGYKKGLVKTLFGCFSLIVAIVVASIFGAPVGSVIKNSAVFDGITQSVTDEISANVDDLSENTDDAQPQTLGAGLGDDGISHGERLVESFSESPLGKTLFRLGVDEKQIKKDFVAAIDGVEEKMKNSSDVKELFVSVVAVPVLDCIATALGTVIVFVLSLILLKILCYFLDKVFKLPLLSTVNKYGGLCAGIVSGIVGVYVLCMIVETLLPIIPANPVLYPGMAENTLVYSFFVNLNPVRMLLLG